MQDAYRLTGRRFAWSQLLRPDAVIPVPLGTEVYYVAVRRPRRVAASLWLHSDPLTLRGRRATQRCDEDPRRAVVAPAATAIRRPAGEKRAPYRLLLGCDSTVCRSPVESFVKSTVFACPGWNVSRLDPSGDQSQVLKQPFSIVTSDRDARLCSITMHP